jgi:hypothetical protein
MYKILVYIIFGIISIFPSIAQDEFNEEQTSVYTRFGPYYAFKAGVNGGNTPLGRQNAVSFNGIPDFGAMLIMPIGGSENIGLGLDLGYTTFSFITKNYETGEKFTESFSYIAFAPNIYFSGFLLGLSVGFPVNADWGAKIDTDDLNIISDVRLNYTYFFKSDYIGSLGVYLQASYMLTGAFKDFSQGDPLKEYIPAVSPQVLNNNYNPRVVALSLGFTYLFNLDF